MTEANGTQVYTPENAQPLPGPVTAIEARNASQGLTLQEKQSIQLGFGSIAGFEGLYRAGSMLASSGMVPDTFRGKPGDCAVAIEIAARLDMSPVLVMQNMFLVKGKVSWSGAFMAAIVNKSKLFDPLDWEWKSEEGKDDWGCRAFAKDRRTNKIRYGRWVEWKKHVVGEGWLGKDGSKWKTMAEMMFVYRSSSWWMKQWYPEGLQGLPAADEIEDAIDVTPTRQPTPTEKKAVDAAKDSIGKAERRLDEQVTRPVATPAKTDAPRANSASEGKSPAAADAGGATGEVIAGSTAPQQTAAPKVDAPAQCTGCGATGTEAHSGACTVSPPKAPPARRGAAAVKAVIAAKKEEALQGPPSSPAAGQVLQQAQAVAQRETPPVGFETVDEDVAKLDAEFAAQGGQEKKVDQPAPTEGRVQQGPRQPLPEERIAGTDFTHAHLVAFARSNPAVKPADVMREFKVSYNRANAAVAEARK